jgi:hypothetical protein
LLDFPGTVDFRFCDDTVQMMLSDRRYTTGTYINTGSIITRILRNDIASYTTFKLPFQTKVNALNTLADIGIALLNGRVWGDEDALVETTLCSSLLKIATLLSDSEIGIVSNEMRALLPDLSPEYCDDP